MGKVERYIEPTSYKYTQRPIYYYVNENGCWNCVSHRLDRDGYARVDRGGREWQMHRYIYTISNQICIPPKMEIMHICDNPTCMNPEHLKMGTHEENMGHKKLHNRVCKVRHNLNENEIVEIKESELTIPVLALEYNVSHSTIVRRKAENRNKKGRVGNKPSIKNHVNGGKKTKKASTE